MEALTEGSGATWNFLQDSEPPLRHIARPERNDRRARSFPNLFHPMVLPLIRQQVRDAEVTTWGSKCCVRQSSSELREGSVDEVSDPSIDD